MNTKFLCPLKRTKGRMKAWMKIETFFTEWGEIAVNIFVCFVTCILLPLQCGGDKGLGQIYMPDKFTCQS